MISLFCISFRRRDINASTQRFADIYPAILANSRGARGLEGHTHCKRLFNTMSIWANVPLPLFLNESNCYLYKIFANLSEWSQNELVLRLSFGKSNQRKVKRYCCRLYLYRMVRGLCLFPSDHRRLQILELVSVL